MSARVQTHIKAPVPPAFALPVRSGLLQGRGASGSRVERMDVNTAARTGFGYDFSQTPLYPKASIKTKIQAKLTVSAPGDIYEQDADRVADEVMAGGPPAVVRATQGIQPKLCRVVMRPEDKYDSALPTEEESQDGLSQPGPSAEVQRSASGEANAPSSQFERSLDQAMRQGGEELPGPTRAFMETRLGWNFSSVRVHNDAKAHTLAREVSARAFTLNPHIFFDSSQYQPESTEGRHLLAHELTHVVQQSEGRLSRKIQRRTSCTSYSGYNASANLTAYNCAGLALRTYQWHSPPSDVYQAILANFVGPESPSGGTCGAGNVKFWLWEYDIHTEDDRGNIVNPTWQDFHVVAGRVDANGNDPTNVYTKNGARSVHGPGAGPSFRPPARDRATANDPSEQPITTPLGRPVFKVRTNMTESITCAGCSP
jgi:hypothetical protein